jgi:hypothetical protein
MWRRVLTVVSVLCWGFSASGRNAFSACPPLLRSQYRAEEQPVKGLLVGNVGMDLVLGPVVTDAEPGHRPQVAADRLSDGRDDEVCERRSLLIGVVVPIEPDRQRVRFDAAAPRTAVDGRTVEHGVAVQLEIPSGRVQLDATRMHAKHLAAAHVIRRSGGA